MEKALHNNVIILNLDDNPSGRNVSSPKCCH